MQNLSLQALKTQPRPTFRCDGCCRRFPTSDLGHIECGLRFCADCMGFDLQTHLGVIAIFKGVVRALEDGRVQLAQRFVALGCHELSRFNGTVAS